MKSDVPDATIILRHQFEHHMLLGLLLISVWCCMYTRIKSGIFLCFLLRFNTSRGNYNRLFDVIR